MSLHPPTLSRRWALSLLVLALGAGPAWAQAGIVLTGAGPINRSMGGASVGAPLDGTGALYWNPATISALPSSSLDFGLELLYPQTRLSSSISGLGAGSDRGDNGIFPLPTGALVYKVEGEPWTFGLAATPVGGFGVNYAASNSNPVLTPQPPNGGGLGAIFTELQVIQVAPSVAIQITDQLSIGGGPILDLVSLRADPLFLTAPNADGTYPSGTHSRVSWGAGFQLGVYYALDDGWGLGASFKSPQWFEDLRFLSTDQLGRPRTSTVNFDFPMITSIGVGYSGFERWLLAADLRHIDYGNTNGFRQGGFDPQGAVRGLGWRSIFAVALGAQYQWTDEISVRAGYSYNQNPIADSQSSFNVASPTILEHSLYLGASYKVSDNLSLSVAYVHCFQNSVNGPLVTPFGAVPGSSVSSTTSADSLLLGATVRFGGKCSAN